MAFGNDELDKMAPVGEEALCGNCHQYHKVEYGEKVLEDGTKIPSKLLSFIKCTKDGTLYLVGVNGKSIQ